MSVKQAVALSIPVSGDQPFRDAPNNVKVDSNHIRRMKHHILEFFAEPCIGCIIGTNGYIWIEAPRRKVEKGQETAPVTLAERQRIAALRNAIIILDKQNLPIYKETILKIIEAQ